MKSGSEADRSAIGRELETLKEELAGFRAQLGALEQRIRALEVREELWQAPQAAGDGPVPE